MNTDKENKTGKAIIPFGKKNYIIMGAGAVLVLLGFIVMYGGTEDIFSFRRTTLPVLMIMAGFGLEIYGIMKK